MAKGRWNIKVTPLDVWPLDLPCHIVYESIFGDIATLAANGVPCAFNEDDAETITGILNKQIEQAVEYCTEQLKKENEL